MAERALRIVEEATGEISECPSCQALQDQLAEAESDIRSYRAKIRMLKRDKEAAARRHALWPQAVELFGYWQEKCNHPRSKFTVDRFEAILPLLREYGPEICKQGIDGAAFDAFKSKRRNGTMKLHNDWDLIYRSADKLEDFCNRAPRP